MLHMLGSFALVLFLTVNTMHAGSNSSDEARKKERAKNTGWIGIAIQDVNEKIAGRLKLEGEEGAYVKEVVDDSPADSAGVSKGDVIVEFHQKKVIDANDLVKAVRRTEPGTKADLVVIRDGKKSTLQVIVGKSKGSNYSMSGPMPDIPDVHVFIGNRMLGMQLLTLNEQLGEYFGAPNNEGVLVEEVEHESTAEQAGVKAGDIIIRMGKKSIDDVEKIQKELRNYDEGDKVEFEVLRKGAKKTISMEIEEEQGFPHRFFFRKPHMQMFRMNPFFDDASNQWDMKDLQSSLNRAQRNLRKSLEERPCDILHQFNRVPAPLPEQTAL